MVRRFTWYYMIYGSVLRSQKLKSIDGWDFYMFMVKVPDTEPAGKHSIWVSVYTSAQIDGIEFGVFVIPYVKHHLTKENKSAFKRVNKKFCQQMAWEDAVDMLDYVNSN